MIGREGDWWVEDQTGRGRSVADSAFRELYEHVQGDVYRRTGLVVARQATHPELVASLEGESLAEPGMWIVSDDRGNSWSVPDDHFRDKYLQVLD
jgi:hypothetical protein